MGQEGTFTSHVSTHLLWKTWPHLASFLHHWPCLIPSKQTTQSVFSPSALDLLQYRNCGSFLSSLIENSLEEELEGVEWRWRAAVARRRRMEATPRIRKKRVVTKTIIMAFRIKDKNF
uniref:Uncharacterized protein n=1 Tax=Rhizophora mucronata TaxID=61149 RepID=A0A2P2Q4N7_RHIMU